MSDLLLPQIFWLPVFVGYGFIFNELLRRFPGAETRRTTFGEYGILGFVSYTSIVSLLNYFSALKHWTLLLAVIGFFLFVMFLYKAQERLDPREIFLSFLLILLIGFSGYFSKPLWDMGAYHLPLVKWAWEHPIPIGGANLNKFFGFHSQWYVLNAGMILSWKWWKMILGADSLLLVFFVLHLFKNVTHSNQAISSFSFVMLFLVAIVNFAGQSGANSSDLPAMVFALMAFYEIIGGWKSTSNLFYALVWALYSMSCKLSMVPLVAGILFFLVLSHYKSRAPLKTSGFLTLTICFLILGQWILRGFLLTGCVLFPVPGTCMHTINWAVPISFAEDLKKFIDAKHSIFTKLDGGPNANSHVWSIWVPSLLSDLSLRLAGASLFILGTVRVFRRRLSYELNGFDTSCLIALIVVSGGIAFWLISAPSPRFGMPYFIFFTAIVLVSVIPKGFRMDWRMPRGKILILLLMLLWVKRTWALYQIEDVHWSGRSFVPEQGAIEHKSANGITYLESELYGQCWDLPLPCAYFQESRLKIFQSKNGRYSFSIQKM